MEWDRELLHRLDDALNESQVCGLSFDPEAAEARLFLEVLALPETGPIDRDLRRVLILSGVFSSEVILRADRDDALGPVLPLEEFVADGRRWWVALRSGDSRLSSDAQQLAQASAASWRSWGGAQ